MVGVHWKKSFSFHWEGSQLSLEELSPLPPTPVHGNFFPCCSLLWERILWYMPDCWPSATEWGRTADCNLISIFISEPHPLLPLPKPGYAVWVTSLHSSCKWRVCWARRGVGSTQMVPWLQEDEKER